MIRTWKDMLRITDNRSQWRMSRWPWLVLVDPLFIWGFTSSNKCCNKYCKINCVICGCKQDVSLHRSPCTVSTITSKQCTQGAQSAYLPDWVVDTWQCPSLPMVLTMPIHEQMTTLSWAGWLETWTIAIPPLTGLTMEHWCDTCSLQVPHCLCITATLPLLLRDMPQLPHS